jgi:hypothetical protein
MDSGVQNTMFITVRSCFCQARRLSMRLQAALRESGLCRSANESTQEPNPIRLLNEFEKVLVLQNDRRRRSLAPSPEMTPRQA